MTSLHSEVLDAETSRMLAPLQHVAALAPLHLGGGTAAALHVGHRRVDVVEMWSHTRWDWWSVGPALDALGEASVDVARDGEVGVRLDGLAMRLRDREFPMSEPLEPTAFGPLVSSLTDALAEVLLSVREGGARSDYIDVFCLCKHGGTLAEGLEALGEGPHISAIAVGLGRVEHAREEPSPEMLVPVPWREVERFLLAQAASLGA